ncbi:hypothetical protein [Roseateles sp.]|uniref:hypothetical protein n=1 Tax=Roseateles sp. TaxID=1971397 RepID=UPI0032634B8D
MKCPYCVSVIDEQALACPHCTRDLFLFKPLLARLQTQETALDEVMARVAVLESGAAPTHDEPPDTAPTSPPAGAAALPAWAVLPPAFVLLLAAHYVIVMALDLPTLWLRLASLAIPLPFGYLLQRGSSAGALRNLLLAAITAALAVLGMSVVVALVDGATVLPANARELREFGYYVVSILLSLVTGMVIARSQAPSPQGRWLTRAATTAWGAARDPVALQKQLDALRNLGITVMATATALGSVASGLKGVIGN